MNDLKISIQKKIRQALIHKRPKIVPGDQTSKYTYTGTNAHAVMLDNVTYYPKYNTVFDSQGRLILESVKGHFKPEKYSLRKLHLSSKDEIDGICSVFRSMFRHSNYYHTVIDHLPRLYLIKKYKSTFQSLGKIKLLVPGGLTETEKFFTEKILPEDVEAVPVDADRIYHLKHILLPDYIINRHPDGLPIDYLNFFRSSVLPDRPRRKENLVYISRKFSGRNSKRCVLNEDDLLLKLESYGFQRYHLEDMSVQEQINLFYDASFVVSPHGAGLTNIIFSDGLNVLELFPLKCSRPHYEYLSKTLNHNYIPWFPVSGVDRDSNFYVDVEHISSLVESILMKSSRK